MCAIYRVHRQLFNAHQSEKFFSFAHGPLFMCTDLAPSLNLIWKEDFWSRICEMIFFSLSAIAIYLSLWILFVSFFSLFIHFVVSGGVSDHLLATKWCFLQLHILIFRIILFFRRFFFIAMWYVGCYSNSSRNQVNHVPIKIKAYLFSVVMFFFTPSTVLTHKSVKIKEKKVILMEIILNEILNNFKWIRFHFKFISV